MKYLRNHPECEIYAQQDRQQQGEPQSHKTQRSKPPPPAHPAQRPHTIDSAHGMAQACLPSQAATAVSQGAVTPGQLVTSPAMVVDAHRSNTAPKGLPALLCTRPPLLRSSMQGWGYGQRYVSQGGTSTDPYTAQVSHSMPVGPAVTAGHTAALAAGTPKRARGDDDHHCPPLFWTKRAKGNADSISTLQMYNNSASNLTVANPAAGLHFMAKFRQDDEVISTGKICAWPASPGVPQ